MYKFTEYDTDVLIIGCGGAGITVANHLSKLNIKISCIVKTTIHENHTSLAQGGINACLGNVESDNLEWFIYDTMKGGGYLSDHDSVYELCSRSSNAINYLQEKGVPFTLNDEGKIYQRPYGGQTLNFGKEIAHRACCVADKTGEYIMSSLISNTNNVIFYERLFAFKLVIISGQVEGVLCVNLSSLEIIFFRSKFVVIATGGSSQMYKTNTSLDICTGDGNSLALDAGIMLQDMEFIQFHPTGLKGSGKLISEAARAEGGYLTNNIKEKFMKNYDAKLQDLTSRDVVARAIYNEILSGRGCTKDKDCVYLNINHLSKKVILELLPTVYNTVDKYCNIDPIASPIPVKPTAHYIM